MYEYCRVEESKNSKIPFLIPRVVVRLRLGLASTHTPYTIHHTRYVPSHIAIISLLSAPLFLRVSVLWKSNRNPFLLHTLDFKNEVSPLCFTESLAGNSSGHQVGVRQNTHAPNHPHRIVHHHHIRTKTTKTTTTTTSCYYCSLCCTRWCVIVVVIILVQQTAQRDSIPLGYQ